MNDAGGYTEEVTDYVGVNVFDANPLIARRLRDENNRPSDIPFDELAVKVEAP